MNYRLTIAAAMAVILASCSEWVLIQNAGWLFASIGAVSVIALAGVATRLPPNLAAAAATVISLAVSAPLLTDPSLPVKLAGVLIVGCCAASFSRIRMFRPIADVVTYAGALLLYLNLILSHAKSSGYVIPTARSLHHLITLADRGAALAKYSPPVPDTRGVILLAAAGIGLAAIVVDVVAIGLHRPAIAGLPLLVVYMAPIATAAKPSGPASALTFIAAATGYMALLASDGKTRLRGWGRLVTVWHYAGDDERLGGADIRGLAATGRRIGIAAVCAAIVAPLLLPSLNLHRLFTSGSTGSKTQGPSLPNPIDQLHTMLGSSTALPVLSYRSKGKDPGEYFQVYVLNYDPAHGQWRLIPPAKSITVGATALLQPPGVAASTTILQTTTQVKLGNLKGSAEGYTSPLFFLPVPYFPVELTVNGSWSEAAHTLMIYSGSADHTAMSYTVTSGHANVTPAEERVSAPIPHDISAQYLGFSSSVTPQLTQIARQITNGATTPFAKAQALEQYFQAPGNFVYTLKALDLPNSPRGLLAFLTTGRQGSCEQFAFAMAVLARLVHIPSRVAIGYTSGAQNRPGGWWRVTTADSHAWPELYFRGLGWLRFEPTPGGTGGQGSATQPVYAKAGKSGASDTPGGPASPGVSTPPPTTGIQDRGHIFRGPQTGAGSAGSAATPPSQPVPVMPILLSILVLLLLAAMTPAVARVISSWRRWRAATDDTALARAAWLEICADLDDLGLGHPASETPRAMARRLRADASIDGAATAAIGRIATIVERCRYAPEPVTATGIRADVRQVRRSLARSAGLTTRLRARIFPASAITPLLLRARHSLGQFTGWVSAPGES